MYAVYTIACVSGVSRSAASGSVGIAGSKFTSGYEVKNYKDGSASYVPAIEMNRGMEDIGLNYRFSTMSRVLLVLMFGIVVVCFVTALLTLLCYKLDNRFDFLLKFTFFLLSLGTVLLFYALFPSKVFLFIMTFVVIGALFFLILPLKIMVPVTYASAVVVVSSWFFLRNVNLWNKKECDNVFWKSILCAVVLEVIVTILFSRSLIRSGFFFVSVGLMVWCLKKIREEILNFDRIDPFNKKQDFNIVEQLSSIL